MVVNEQSQKNIMMHSFPRRVRHHIPAANHELLLKLVQELQVPQHVLVQLHLLGRPLAFARVN